MQIYIDLMSKIPVGALLLMSATGVILGDYFAKYWSQDPRPLWFVLTFVAYFFSPFFYVPTLLREGLVVTSVVWSILNIIGYLFIGLVIFRETLSGMQIIGVILGVMAFVMLSWR
jgi:multidrug transporter EmrE-like cation transporter